MLIQKRHISLSLLAVLVVTTLLAAQCGAPSMPETVVETVIVKETVEVEKIVRETVEVEVEKEVVVTKEVEVEKEVVREVEVTSTPEPGRQTLIVGLSQVPLTLDPADYRDRVTETVIRNMFDGLVTRDTRSGVHLELAEEMNWLDEQTLEVKLRQGVKFHDGVEMTADDVVFTFDRSQCRRGCRRFSRFPGLDEGGTHDQIHRKGG